MGTVAIQKEEHNYSTCNTTALEFYRTIDWTNHAGTDGVRSIYHTKSFEAHFHEFMAGKRGPRDRRRHEAFTAANELHPRAQRVLVFLVAIYQALNKVGTVVTEEVCAHQVKVATGGAMSTRTFRRAIAELERLGFITITLVNTGNKVRAGSGWKMLQVNRITLTAHLGQLIGLKAVPEKKVPHGEKKRASRRVAPTDSPKVVHRPKRPTDKRENLSEQETFEKSPVLTSNNSKKTKTNAETERGDSYRARNEVKPTSAPPSSAHVKQNRIGEPGKAGKPAKKAVLALYGRRSRNQVPKTYAKARDTFLHELKRHSIADTPETKEAANTWHRIASLHTHPAYPPLFPMAMDFDKYLFGWLDYSWHERRRIMRNDIIPALKSFCADLHQPHPSEYGPGVSDDTRRAALRQKKAYDRLSMRLQSIPALLLECEAPEELKLRVRRLNMHLSRYPSLLHGGMMQITDIDDEFLKSVREIADGYGVNDEKNFFCFQE